MIVETITDPQLVLAWFTGSATLITAVAGLINSLRNTRKLQQLHDCLDTHHETMISVARVAVETAIEAKEAVQTVPAATAALVKEELQK